MITAIKKILKHEYIYIALIAFLAGFLSFFRLGEKSFWFDETFTVFITQNNIFMLDILWNHEANMWFYYLLIHFWQIISINEVWVRGFSVLFAILSVFPFYFLAKKLFNTKVAKIASLLLPFNFFFIFNAQNARSYSLLLFLTLIASLLFLRFVNQPTSKNKIFFCLVSVLAIYAHVYAGFLLIGQMVYLYLEKKNESLQTILWIGFFQGLLLLPFLISPAFRGDQVGWLDSPSVYAPLGIFSLLAGDFLASTILFGLISIWVFYLVFKNLSQPTIRYCLLLIFIPIICSLTISFLLKPIYQSIYLFVSLPYFLILISYGLSKISSKIINTTIIISILFLSLIRLYGWYYQIPTINFFIENQKEQWREVTKDIVSRSEPSDGMIFFPYNLHVSVEAYLRNYPAIRLETIQLTDEYYSLGGNTKILPFPDKDRLEYALKYDRLWFVEGGTDLHKESNAMQKESIVKFIHEYYIPIDHKEYFDVSWTLFKKR
jgi:hypothetical protein